MAKADNRSKKRNRRTRTVSERCSTRGCDRPLVNFMRKKCACCASHFYGWRKKGAVKFKAYTRKMEITANRISQIREEVGTTYVPFWER